MNANHVLIPFHTGWLALSLDEFTAALERGRSLAPAPAKPQVATADSDRILDADGMEKATGIPATWFLEQARRGEIPHLRAGKYRRFVVREVLDAIATRRPIAVASGLAPARETARRPQPETTRNARGGSA